MAPEEAIWESISVCGCYTTVTNHFSMDYNKHICDLRDNGDCDEIHSLLIQLSWEEKINNYIKCNNFLQALWLLAHLNTCLTELSTITGVHVNISL